MITRRGFMIAGGATIGALAMAAQASALAMQGAEKLTISSPSRVLELAQQGSRHITLSGDRMKDLATLEQVFATANDAEINLHIDTADRVLLDIALTRIETGYQLTAQTGGSFSYRRVAV